jgi:hypothetical protein
MVMVVAAVAAVAVASMVAVAATDDDRWQKWPATRALTVA